MLHSFAWHLEQTVAPAVEPVTAAEAKSWARVDIDDDDTLIEALIVAARDYCEQATRRQFITATWAMRFRQFPGGGFYLPVPPLQSVTSITYVDSSGDTQTLDTDIYDVSTTGEYGQIVLAYGQEWPDVRGDIDGITVTFVAGYGDEGSDVPTLLQTAIKMIVAHWYDNRVPVANVAQHKVPYSAEALLNMYKVRSY